MIRIASGKRQAVRRLQASRPAITLLELLIAVSIISIIAALLVGVAARAGEVARDARTRSLIGRLHTLVIERYDQYRTRRVELGRNALPILQRRPAWHGITGPLNDLQLSAATRLAAIREMMRIEMPDRWSDFIDSQYLGSAAVQPANYSPAFLNEPPTLWRTYARAYNRVANGENTITGMPNTVEEILTNQSAECLYLLVMNATGDGEAPSLFSESDIGDTDGDGALEFLDGWDQPIGFIRWAPGFDSDAQWSVASLQRRFARPPTNRNLTPRAAVLDAVFEDHDPFDVFRLDNPPDDLDGFDETTDSLAVRGWRLVPLIFSIGSDAEAGIQLGSGDFLARVNPYADAEPSTSGIQRLGQITGDPEAYADNLHSHDVASLSTRR